MAIQPGPSGQQRGSGGGDTAGLKLRPARRRGRPLLATLLAVVGLCGIAIAVVGIRAQLKPRTFTAAQQKRIEAWEIAKRWRTTSKAELFPPWVGYELTSSPSGSKGGLKLRAQRLEIGSQETCVRAAGGSRPLMAILNGDGCQALLRSTYTDASRSLVLTAGIAVLKNQASAMAAARYLTGGPAEGQGGPARQLVLSPLRVRGTAAALFGYPQRQLSWVVAAGPYLVMATVGYADGRPHVPVRGDSYVLQEMNSLARGVAVTIAAPLGAQPPVPRCPGAPSC